MNVQLCIRGLAAAACLSACLALTGCGLQAAPQPPSLNLPNPVVDLSAVRTGNQVTLAWTMPKRTTDKVILQGKIAARICRREQNSTCAAVGSLSLAPGAAGSFADVLPDALASGSPRPLTYSVELTNRKNRSAGPSNPATVLAGQAPAPVTDLTATLARRGVILRWQPVAEATRSAVRLQRTLISAAPARKSSGGLLPPAQTLLRQNLLVPADAQPGPPDRALDESIQFGQVYEYRAQRVTTVVADGKTLELDGPLSEPVRVDALDIFPPAVPSGLAAVANAPSSGAPASIDLSWLHDSDPDLAGYAVYRREAQGEWQRISPAQPVAGPAFHDAGVTPGHAYMYAVTAIGRNGRESARSREASETVPAE